MEEYNEEELLYLIHCGSEEALDLLVKKYYFRISSWVVPYAHYEYLGFDKEDFVQIGIMHFYSLINMYRSDLGTNLYAYMKVGVIRQIVKTISLLSNEGLYQNNFVFSFDEPLCDDESDHTSHDMIADPDITYQPHARFMIKERAIDYKKAFMKKTSPQEKVVMKYVRKGYNVVEISKILDISLKSVYNAIYRSHRKCKPLTKKNKYVKL